MPTKVAQMTTEELKELIGTIIEQKLVELLGDPDEGLVIKKTLQARLLRQRKAVAAGERGEAFEDILAELNLS
jgi:hypothetical protein